MAYLYKMYFVVEDDVENLFYQTVIDEIVEKGFANQSNIDIVGAQICELNHEICGKCCKCGSWVSDQEKTNHIDGFSDGCFINGEWWCDLCIPHNHPKYFT